MASEVVDTIVLSGEDSINFANNLFRPSIDFLNSNSQILASIEKNIHITDIDNGFVADIANLDLDFLDKTGEEEKKFNIEVTINVNIDTDFYNNEEQNNGLTWVVNNNDCYGKPEDSGYLSYAA
jgi:hypothetical protein